MIKQVALLKSKPGFSYEQFIRRYEEGHVVLVNEVFPYFAAYRRNYIVPRGTVSLDHIKSAHPLPSFDVITEFWFKDQAAMDALSRTSSETDAGERVSQDESEFLDQAGTVIVECEERVTPEHLLRPKPASAAGKPAIKYVALAKAKPGTSRDALISHYEDKHSRLGLELLRKDGESIFARYSRSYPKTNGTPNFEHLGYESQGVDFDVMSQFSFWTRDDFEAFRAMCADPEIGALLLVDEERFLDRQSITTFMVEEHESRY